MNSITITKTKFAIAITAIALLVPATAWATHTFSDVEDDRFYSGPVAWAFENGITTGTSETTFSPEDPVTRGQNVTFINRYHENIVEPAFVSYDGQIAVARQVTSDDSAAAFANGDASAVAIGSGVSVQSVTMTVPVDGKIIANSAVRITSSSATIPACSLNTEAAHDGLAQQVAGLDGVTNTNVNLANTRGFDVEALSEVTIYLFCTQVGTGAEAFHPTITAMFTAD